MVANSAHASPEIFSISTQIYVRLRRVSGRVVDASYMVQNHDYAKYVIELAQESQDPELLKYAARLVDLLPRLSNSPTAPPPQHQEAQQPSAPETTATPEEVYEKQVHHHYIGFLR
jgi:hypothetical protein